MDYLDDFLAANPSQFSGVGNATDKTISAMNDLFPKYTPSIFLDHPLTSTLSQIIAGPVVLTVLIWMLGIKYSPIPLPADHFVTTAKTFGKSFAVGLLIGEWWAKFDAGENAAFRYLEPARTMMEQVFWNFEDFGYLEFVGCVSTVLLMMFLIHASILRDGGRGLHMWIDRSFRSMVSDVPRILWSLLKEMYIDIAVMVAHIVCFLGLLLRRIWVELRVWFFALSVVLSDQGERLVNITDEVTRLRNEVLY